MNVAQEVDEGVAELNEAVEDENKRCRDGNHDRPDEAKYEPGHRLLFQRHSRHQHMMLHEEPVGQRGSADMA
jgi:hypothetical protein